MKREMINRRRFIRYSATGVAGIICAPAEQTVQCGTEAEPILVYRTLGKTGIRLPVIGMGILSSGTPDLMQAALDAGITHFDSTADTPQQARNEKMIGEVLKRRSRESVTYGTKIHLPQDYKTGLYKSTATEAEFTKKLDEALRNLQMDYVDIVYHHMVSRRESAFHEPIMNAMAKAKKAGKARFLGLTTHNNVPEAVYAAADSKFYEVVMAAYNPRQVDLTQVKEAIAKAAKSGLGVVAIKVIRGDVDKGEQPVNPRASLKWVLQDSNVHATVPGFSNFQEMRVDLSVMEDLSLNDAERIDMEREASGPGMFCQGCGQCLKNCSDQLPVPDLMRAYMYAYGYRQRALAQGLLRSLELPDHVCEDCPSCMVVCTNGWNISEKIRDILRLGAVSS